MRRSYKQKQEPFFVKRVRLRKSILKTTELLETVSIYDLQSTRNAARTTTFKTHKKQLFESVRNGSLERKSIDEIELYSSNSNRYNRKEMSHILKICSHQKNREVEQEMSKVGLEVRRIVGDGKAKNGSEQSSENALRKRSKKEKWANRTFNATISVDSFGLELASPISPLRNEINYQSPHLQKCSTSVPSNRKNRVYLYEKMAKMELSHHEQNHIYEKRIKSYTEFLWKCMLAHNIYINLDLEPPALTSRKYIAYVGYGNNCNMIKGLLRRRFWWTLSEELTEDCAFAWTQIKINKIYEKQERARPNQLRFSGEDITIQDFTDMRFTYSSTLKKRTKEAPNIVKRKLLEEFDQYYSHHRKIWRKEDYDSLKELLRKNDGLFGPQEKEKQKSYHFKTDEVRKRYKEITAIEDLEKLEQEDEEKHSFYTKLPLVHNHLQNNFFLGNKKALFYNLREYYEKIGEDIFNYVPLTFHIKQGFKDPEYQRLTRFYQQRAKTIEQQERSNGKSKKTRNIWIVKPGENSNQGRGITVIDEMYELDRIIKESSSRAKSKEGTATPEAQTFIVQLYIDRPFLYNQRKFDIRHYLLITNLYGITRAYWYEQGYIRTSSYYFNISHFEPEIHLTNDAVQKSYPEYGRYEPCNKISYAEFQNYLSSLNDSRRYNFKQDILTKMKAMAKDAARSVYAKISPQNLMHNFEIFGLDFMIDRNFTPWLIEINTNPCLECVCPLLERIIPYMVQQGLKLTLDLVYPPPTHYPNTSKHFAPLIDLEKFKYELIFDSLSEGEQLLKLYSTQSSSLLGRIGAIEEDEEFKDEGNELRLEDFT